MHSISLGDNVTEITKFSWSKNCIYHCDMILHKFVLNSTFMVCFHLPQTTHVSSEPQTEEGTSWRNLRERLEQALQDNWRRLTSPRSVSVCFFLSQTDQCFFFIFVCFLQCIAGQCLSPMRNKPEYLDFVS